MDTPIAFKRGPGRPRLTDSPAAEPRKRGRPKKNTQPLEIEKLSTLTPDTKLKKEIPIVIEHGADKTIVLKNESDVVCTGVIQSKFDIISTSGKFKMDFGNLQISGGVSYGVVKINDMQIPAISKNMKTYLRAKEICDLFKIKKHIDACAKLAPFSGAKKTLGELVQEFGVPSSTFSKCELQFIYISTHGVNFLALRGKTKHLQDLQYWIASEVMPSISEHGYYITNQVLNAEVDKLKAELAFLQNRPYEGKVYLEIPKPHQKYLKEEGFGYDVVLKKWWVTPDVEYYIGHIARWGPNSTQKKYIDRNLPIAVRIIMKNEFPYLMYDSDKKKLFYYEEDMDDIEIITNRINKLAPIVYYR